MLYIVKVFAVVSLILVDIGRCYSASLPKYLLEANNEPERNINSYSNVRDTISESTSLIQNLAGNEFKLPRKFPVVDFIKSAKCGKYEYIQNVTSSDGCHGIVMNSFCYGLCASITALSPEGDTVQYYRTSCSPSKTRIVRLKLHCPNWTYIRRSVTVVEECSCQQN